MIIAPMPAAIRRILNDERRQQIADDSCCGIDEFEIHYPPTPDSDGVGGRLNLFRFRWSENRNLDQMTMPWEYEHQVWAPGALVCQAMVDLARDALGPDDADEVAKAIPPFLASREATKDCHLLDETLIPEHEVLVEHDKPFVALNWAFNDPCAPLRLQPRWFFVSIPEELIVRAFVGCLRRPKECLGCGCNWPGGACDPDLCGYCFNLGIRVVNDGPSLPEHFAAQEGADWVRPHVQKVISYLASKQPEVGHGG